VRRLQKKQQNGDRQGMSKAIRHAQTIANFTIEGLTLRLTRTAYRQK